MNEYCHLRRPEFWPSLFALAALALFITLGSWQIERLHWKERMIAQLEAMKASSPVELFSIPESRLAEEEFQKVAFSGRPLSQTPIHIAARYYKEKLGYHTLIPFETKEGKAVLVNLGWIPADKKEAPYFEDAAKWYVWQRIEGYTRLVNRKGYFTPANQPKSEDRAKNLWFWYDLPELEKTAGQSLMPIVIDRLGPEDNNLLPVAFDGQIKLRNDHLGYAITWFGLAIVTIIMWLAYHRAPRTTSQQLTA